MVYSSVEIKRASYAVLENNVVKKLVFFKNNDEHIEVDVLPPVRQSSGIGGLNRSDSVLSGSYDSLNAFRSSLAAVRAGTANARLLAIGDSTTGGWPTSYINRMADLWAANRLASARQGAIFSTDPPTYAEARVVLGAGWSNAGVGDFGPANRGLAMGAVGASGTLDFGPVTCDRFEIFYLDAGVGSFDWWIDGGSHTTVSVGSSAGIPSPSVVTPSVSLGTHTLHIGNIVGNPVFIPFVEPRIGTSGLYLARAGLGGTTSTMWNSPPSSFSSSILLLHTLQPDLTIIMLTVGDLNNQVTLSTYATNINALVDLAKTYGSVVLAVAPRPTITWPVITYDEYIDVLEGIRDSEGVGMINFAKYFDGDDPDLYMADTLHPRVETQGEMALICANALMP